jgi:hypothetical protein
VEPLSLHPKKLKKKKKKVTKQEQSVACYNISALFMKLVLLYNTLVQWTVKGTKLRDLKALLSVVWMTPSHVLVPEEHVRHSLIDEQQITHRLAYLPLEYVGSASF